VGACWRGALVSFDDIGYPTLSPFRVVAVATHSVLPVYWSQPKLWGPRYRGIACQATNRWGLGIDTMSWETIKVG
jgi:hypothetical protein